MKKLPAALLSLSLLLSALSPAFAVTPSARPVLLRQDIKSQRQQTHQDLKQERQDFKQKLAQIKDQHKQQLTEQIDQRIQQINQNRTEQMTKALDTLGTILDHIASKEAQTNASSESAVITQARNSLATSQQAVATQAAKDYVIQLGDEAQLGSAVRTTVHQFTTDIKATHQTVRTARSLVIQAARAMAKINHATMTNQTPASGAATH